VYIATAAGKRMSTSSGRTSRTPGSCGTAGGVAVASNGWHRRMSLAGPQVGPSRSHRSSTAPASPTSDEHVRGSAAAISAKAATARGVAMTGMRLAPSQQIDSS
jgi:hypothetical protein